MLESESSTLRKMFLSSGLILLFSIGLSSSRFCNISGTSYICTDMTKIEDFMFSLPAFAQKVMLIGTDNIMESFPSGIFQDTSWFNLSELSLHLFTHVYSIEKFLLKGLRNLKYLSISECYRLELIDSDLFDNTSDLEALHLDGNFYLSLSTVENALKGKVSKLKYLSLKEIQTYNRQASFLDNNFLNALDGKKLLYFDISLANIAGVLWSEAYLDTLYNLRYFNVSHTKLTLYNLKGLIPSYHYQNLEVFDISGCQSYTSAITLSTPINSEECSMPRNLKFLFVDNVFIFQTDIDVQFEGTFNDCSYCRSLELFDCSNNRLFHLNFTMTRLKCFQNLVTLNLSRNGLENISPLSLGIFSSLTFLDMSENRLYKMECTTDFNNLLEGNYMLEALFFRKNQLSLIPRNFFINNSRLSIIDLRDNELSVLSINFSNNLNLKNIYLGGNRLRFLDFITYQTLDALCISQTKDNISYSFSIRSNISLDSFDRNVIRERYAYNSLKTPSNIKEEFKTFIKHLMIDLSKNPIECRCENERFLKWVIDTCIQFMNAESLVCSYGNSFSPIDRKLYESITFNCLLLDNLTKGISATLSVILCVIIAILVIRKVRLNGRKAKIVEILKKEIRKRRRNFNYVAFIPYCSYDYGVVEEIILPALRASLKKTLDTDIEVICTGVENFIPGRYIIDEIHRCVDECLVVVPIITSAFIRSPWSKNECSVAIQKQREVLVLMENQTDITEAEQTIKNLIEECTRASWSIKDGQLVIHPSLELFCDRIITAAAETLIKQKQYHRQMSENMFPLLEESNL